MNWITTKMNLQDLIKVNADPAFIEAVKAIAKNFGIAEENAEFVRKGITPSDLKVEDDEKAIVSYITTKAVDRDGEIVDPDGAVLDDYRKHPVVLFGHDYKQLPIGKNIWIKQDKKGLVAKTKYANHDEAQKVYQYRKDGFPLAQSIGFVPIEFDEFPADVQKKNGGVKRHYKKWALLEYSDVPIPSNPEALQVAISKGLSLPETLKENPQFDPDQVIDIENIETKERKVSVNEIQDAVDKALKKMLAPAEEASTGIHEVYAYVADLFPINFPDGEFIYYEGKEMKYYRSGYTYDAVTRIASITSERNEVGREWIEKNYPDFVSKVETTASLHRIPVPAESGEHDDHKIRTIDISKDDGIQALYCVDCKTIITYLFDKDEWDLDEAKKWVEEHEDEEEDAGKKSVVSSVAVAKALQNSLDEHTEVIDILFIEGEPSEGKVVIGRKFADDFVIHGATFSYDPVGDSVDIGERYLIDSEEVKDLYPEYFETKEDDGEEIIEKAGRVLSGKNQAIIEDTIDQVGEALAALRSLLDLVSGEKEEKEIEDPVEKEIDLDGIKKELEERKTEEVPEESELNEEDVRKMLESVLGNIEKTLLNKATEAAEISIRKLLGKVS